jgi:hypothetical protein
MLDFVKKLFRLEPKKQEPWPFPTSRPQEPVIDAVDMTPTLTLKVEEPVKVEKKAKKTAKPKTAKTPAAKKPKAKKEK